MTLEVCRVYCAETSWSLYLEMSNLTTSHRQREARRNGSTEATDTSRIRMELEESNTGVELGKRSRETMESTHSICCIGTPGSGLSPPRITTSLDQATFCA